ncbi:MAG TPA: cation acetate symporter [Armatimonadota bacterium]|nr:cation acetate symporter [Armatimonadota bacterium]
MSWIPITMVVLVVVATIGLGLYAARVSHTASDFFVAGRSVSVFWNASAISGEYLSAASFMGVAGFVMQFGYDALWYPVGYAAGYLFLLLFIAGPLRRFGAYTIPDFAEGRFASPAFRKIAVTFVLFIGFFYTMPQMKGAGLSMNSIFQTPYWVGVVAVGLVISFNVALGGMKGITFVQAFQYWLKMFAISVPVFVLMAVYGGYDRFVSGPQSQPAAYPRYAADVERSFKAGSTLTIPAGDAYTLEVMKEARLKKVSPARTPQEGEDPLPSVQVTAAGSQAGSMGHNIPDEGVVWPAGATVQFPRTAVTRNGQPVTWDGKPVVTGVKLEFERETQLRFRAGSAAAGTITNREWLQPFGRLTNKHGFPLLYTFSLIIGLIFGTAGLPHILVRFYTNPDGRAAKRTTLWVMVLIGVFYMFPAIWGAMGRELMPQLYANGRTDAVVVELPGVLGGVWGDVLRGVTCAGAFAAFMSTFSGLLVSMSGALAHDIYGTIIRPQSSPQQRLVAFKVAAVVIGGVATGLGLMAEGWDIAKLVGWAFAIAAASYFPLLLLGSWWRGLTMKGAATGMLVGGLASLGAIIVTMLIDAGKLAWTPDPVVRTLMEQPAIWGVPLSLGLMFVVSLLTRSETPKDVDTMMLRLHAPEELGMSKDYIPDAH